MAGRYEWRVITIPVAELEQELNKADSEGYEVAHLFPPEDSNAQFFTVVVRRARQGAGGRSMGFGDDAKA
ncbi:MAG: hypothetical protein ACYTGB_15075 [Planctomycetota bacterium]|jgi:hypothetical protein